MDKKRLLYIILFIVAVGLIGFAFYYVFIRKPAPPPITNAPLANIPINGLPSAITGLPPGTITNVPSTISPLPTASPVAQGGLTQAPLVTVSPAQNPFLSSDGQKVNYYNTEDGKFYRVETDGTPQILSNKIFFNVQKVTWSPQGNKGILEYPDASKIFYDFTTDKQVTLPKHWEGFSFSKNGNEIAAKSIGLDYNNRWLLVANPDGTNAQTIFPLGNNADKVQVSWSPAGEIIGFSNTGVPQDFGKKQIITLTRSGDTLNPLLVEGLDFHPLWSKEGDKLVYSTFNQSSDLKPTLWVTNAQGNETGTGRHKLNVDTWAEKCAFADNNTLYCAVPTELQYGAGFEPSVADKTPDQIYKIDLTNNLKTLIATPDSNSSVSSLMITGDKSVIFFTDKSGQLHQLKLK
ncbi:MAG: hypothetical protein UT86_C0005G0015 [Candidatus Magasanikbacteria bacterium GW2011_GWC2_40_17]|uniref:Uncharacterized protein n=1 Tax=Candidatus Magasanikbacteria bacterium GW2011_GWA2_42_32 TaxID=1619039 RepID=A0A0G1CDH7_9BACT|nr:MAG: hypothetical protein UT86_C0005G0015 [Candidatus Magasanikbacteria bacterium GW2011_GWC2_40_17]KKS56751.1 MAG: hypothetical protein UV20_C0006G0034 [Candidatus Magasanikbacteria bacterium GW2011_GWA2_42_32]OGH86060.1 MAG: hypothetical protein A2294_02245 [Candidatus Magasanikbacteria bacterium RIFOXYB2_FULL_38_10]